jgi:Kef-type K+ transport system membrane component KefB
VSRALNNHDTDGYHRATFSADTRQSMSTTERFLIAMLIILSVPYLIWRLGRTDYVAPLVVVQTIAGILLGPGILGAAFPDYYSFVFTPGVIQALNGVSWWAVTLFVWIAGMELDVVAAWRDRRETAITSTLALGCPLVLGCITAALIVHHAGWIGESAHPWQFVLGVGISSAVTALPVLILFLEKLEILRQPLGQRLLRYASLDDIAIWGVLAAIMMDWQRMGWQLGFLIAFAVAAWGFRHLMIRMPQRDRWYVGLIWLAICSVSADACGFDFIVGAFLAGAVMERNWLDEAQVDQLRQHLLLTVMPVFFLISGLRTNWSVGGEMVLLLGGALLIASVAGKLLGTHLAAAILRWPRGEASMIGWLLQTKGLIMIIFANVLLDKHIITNATFTALLLMAIGSTMLTIPRVAPRLKARQMYG